MNSITETIIDTYSPYKDILIEETGKLLNQLKSKLRGGDNIIYAEKQRGGIMWSGFVCLTKRIEDENFLTEVENCVYRQFPQTFKNKTLTLFSYGTFKPSIHHSCGLPNHSNAYSFAYSIDAINSESSYISEGNSEEIIDTEVDRILNCIQSELEEKKEIFLDNINRFKDTTFGLGSQIVCQYSNYTVEIVKRTVLKFNRIFPKFSLIASYHDRDTDTNKFLVQYRLDDFYTPQLT